MTVLDLGNNVDFSQHLAPVALGGTVTPTAQDLQGFTWGIICINMGVKANTASSYTFTVEESVDNAAFTTVKKFVDGEVSATDATYAVTATPGTTDDQNLLVAFDARRLNRYLRVKVTIGGSGTDAFPAAISIIGMPANTADADDSTFSI